MELPVTLDGAFEVGDRDYISTRLPPAAWEDTRVPVSRPPWRWPECWRSVDSGRRFFYGANGWHNYAVLPGQRASQSLQVR